ncbi:MAG: OsmC family protein [Pseudomonadota bacterium]|jgi:putative redox protein
MITAKNNTSSTRTAVSSSQYTLPADTTPPKGAGEGFRPHELLEAALASCTAITLRLVAAERGIALKHVDVTIDLDRTDPAQSVFRSRIAFDDDVSEADRRTLLAAARLCPVRKTLSRAIAFDEIAEQ